LFRSSRRGPGRVKACVASAFVLFGACAKKMPTPARILDPVSISVSRVLLQPAPRYLRATGSFAADQLTDVSPQVSETVSSVPVRVGMYVQKGDVLAQLDRSNLTLRFGQAKAAEEQAEAALLQAQSRLGLTPGGTFDVDRTPEVQSAKAAAETAAGQASLARTNAQRYTDLLKTEDVSQSQYEQAVQQARTAGDQAQAAKGQYQTALNTARQNFQAIASARAGLSGARAQVAIAQKALDDSAVRAPYSGYVSSVAASPGQYVSAPAKVATIVKIDPLQLNIQVPENEQGKLKPGMKVLAQVGAFPDRDFEGEVTALAPSIETTTRTVAVIARFANGQALLRPGMFASVRILVSESANGLFVSAAAVSTDTTSGTSSVFIVDQNKVRQQLVRLGDERGGMVEILSGLTAQSTLAASDLPQLFDGATVSVRR
jgi:multidrug efflux pump subunit AcrA (membrane-fusion protein)